MKNSLKLNQLLETLKAWKEGSIELDHSTAWKMAHTLAEAHYLPAIDFFVVGLSDADWVWRQNCIQFLGFHYLLNQEIMEKVREALITDPSDDVRMSAASVLGGRSSLPDQALFHALESDPNYYVREAAFESILELVGIPYKTINRELKLVRDGKTELTLDYIKHLVMNENIELSEDLLMRSD